jgi:hypothetical protein
MGECDGHESSSGHCLGQGVCQKKKKKKKKKGDEYPAVIPGQDCTTVERLQGSARTLGRKLSAHRAPNVASASRPTRWAMSRKAARNEAKLPEVTGSGTDQWLWLRPLGIPISRARSQTVTIKSGVPLMRS